MPTRNSCAAPDAQEPIGRPAWLTPDRQQTDRPEPQSQLVPQSPLPGTPDDTLQGSRDRMTSRWYALRGIFDGSAAPVEAIPAPVPSRAPALAVFSLAGGVGKTSLVATLGRALSARGERVLLVDTAAFGLLPFFFGATDQRPGVLRTFSPPGESSDAPIQMVTIDPEGLGSEAPNQETLSNEIQKFSRGASRVIVDLATASGSTTRRIMRLSPMVLVPVIPDMNSVVSVSSIDAFFEHNGNPAGKPELPYYVLNQFDASLPLHLDVREVLREQLGERLLPFALRRTPAMSEALAEGMTVMDYAPNSSLADDFSTLAGWVKSLSAPATTSYRGVRWSER
jgi:cellulose synthase operon protein YhjQ